MFDGVSSKKNINLGGKSMLTFSVSRGRSDFLEKQRRERKERELQKQKLHAAKVIQKHFRSFLAIRKVKCEMRTAFHSKMEEMLRNAAGDEFGGDDAGSAEFFQTRNEDVFFFKDKSYSEMSSAEKERLARIIVFFNQNLGDLITQINFFFTVARRRRAARGDYAARERKEEEEEEGNYRKLNVGKQKKDRQFEEKKDRQFEEKKDRQFEEKKKKKDLCVEIPSEDINFVLFVAKLIIKSTTFVLFFLDDSNEAGSENAIDINLRKELFRCYYLRNSFGKSEEIRMKFVVKFRRFIHTLLRLYMYIISSEELSASSNPKPFIVRYLNLAAFHSSFFNSMQLQNCCFSSFCFSQGLFPHNKSQNIDQANLKLAACTILNLLNCLQAQNIIIQRKYSSPAVRTLKQLHVKTAMSSVHEYLVKHTYFTHFVGNMFSFFATDETLSETANAEALNVASEGVFDQSGFSAEKAKQETSIIDIEQYYLNTLLQTLHCLVQTDALHSDVSQHRIFLIHTLGYPMLIKNLKKRFERKIIVYLSSKILNSFLSDSFVKNIKLIYPCFDLKLQYKHFGNLHVSVWLLCNMLTYCALCKKMNISIPPRVFLLILICSCERTSSSYALLNTKSYYKTTAINNNNSLHNNLLAHSTSIDNYNLKARNSYKHDDISSQIMHKEVTEQLEYLLEPFLINSLTTCAEENPIERYPMLLELYFPSECKVKGNKKQEKAMQMNEELKSINSVNTHTDMYDEEESYENCDSALSYLNQDYKQHFFSYSNKKYKFSKKVSSMVLNVLAFCTNLPLKLFNFIKQQYTESCAGNLNEFMKCLKAEAYSSSLSLILKAYCILCHHQLQVMYDSELLGSTAEEVSSSFSSCATAASSLESSFKQNRGNASVLDMDEIVWLSKTLNEVAWRLLEDSVVGKSSKHRDSMNPNSCGIRMQSSVNSTKEAVISLVKLLYDRNTRLKFMEDSEWVLAETRQLLKSRYALLESNYNADMSHNRSVATDSVEKSVANNIHPNAQEILDALLHELPHTMPFEDRVLVFYHFVNKDKEEYRETPFFSSMPHYTIRRNYIVEDGLTTLGCLKQRDLKGVFRVRFVDEEGNAEPGIDGGGLFKEFLITVSRTAFDPIYGLFKASSDNTLYPSPSAHVAHENPYVLFMFLGKVVGKALYEKTLIEPQFNRVFLNLLLGRVNTINDVPAFDPDFHKNLLFLKKFNKNVEDLALSFSVTVGDFGSIEEIDIIPNGRNITVTNETKFQYIHSIANFKVNKQIEPQTRAFLEGLSAVIPLERLRMFNQHELQRLISGTPEGFDVLDLQRNSIYTGGYTDSSPCILWLWEVLEEMSVNERSLFLMFATSCSRAPLLGFQNLSPRFCVHRVPDAGRLPTSSTCVNLLKLPEYKDKVTLKDRLIKAINETEGFGLS